MLLPILYLKGLSTGEFEEALVPLLGKDAGGPRAGSEESIPEPNSMAAIPNSLGYIDMASLQRVSDRVNARALSDVSVACCSEPLARV